VFNFGAHYSPNGMIEWKSNTIPSWVGKILIIRYSGGDDIIVLTVDPVSKAISSSDTGISGFGPFQAPLDIAQNLANGDLYVTAHDDVRDANNVAIGQQIVRLRKNP
jgi:hypothetical protein